MKKLLKNSALSAFALLFVMAFSPLANAAENPFGMSNVATDMQVATNHENGKCGEGKCGDSKKKGKCGDSEKEGKCGEGKCGDSKKKAKCGEGKCGGS